MKSMSVKSLQTGSVIGMLGGGQLGRMMAMSAAQLGFHTHIYCPDERNPGEQVTDKLTRKAYDDREALSVFAQSVDVVTYEFENIPVESVRFLEQHVAVYPSADVLEIAQDRLFEKDFLNKNGIATAAYRAVNTVEEAVDAVAEIGLPAVLKTRRFGYDGKGQVIVRKAEDVPAAWDALGNDRIIVEGFVPFRMEISVLAARGQDGEVCCFTPVENQHKNHILDKSIAPARISADLQEATVDMATTIITALNYVGLLAVEMFVSDDEPQLRVNEIAPRVHNSGHWTIEACATSQFEQHIRAVCGLPLGGVDLYAQAVMTNLIGDDILQYNDLLREAGANVHHYGKSQARPGRKMGHVTRLYPLGQKLPG